MTTTDPAPDPGNSDPSAWTGPMPEDEQAEVRALLLGAPTGEGI